MAPHNELFPHPTFPHCTHLLPSSAPRQPQSRTEQQGFEHGLGGSTGE